jgi:hypothetical protein
MVEIQDQATDAFEPHIEGHSSKKFSFINNADNLIFQVTFCQKGLATIQAEICRR